MLKPEFQTKYDQCVEALEKLGVSVADFRQLLDALECDDYKECLKNWGDSITLENVYNIGSDVVVVGNWMSAMAVSWSMSE